MPIVHSVKIIPIYLHLFEWSNISLIVLCLKSVWWLMAVVVVACQSLFCLQEDCDKTQVPPPNNWSCLSPLHPWSLIISLQSNVYYFICDHFAFFFVRPSFHLFPESILFPPFFYKFVFSISWCNKKNQLLKLLQLLSTMFLSFALSMWLRPSLSVIPFFLTGPF